MRLNTIEGRRRRLNAVDDLRRRSQSCEVIIDIATFISDMLTVGLLVFTV